MITNQSTPREVAMIAIALLVLALPPDDRLERLADECEANKAKQIANVEGQIKSLQAPPKAKPKGKPRPANDGKAQSPKEEAAAAKERKEKSLAELRDYLTRLKEGKTLAIESIGDEKPKIGDIVRGGVSTIGNSTKCIQVVDEQHFIGNFQTKPTLFSNVDTTGFTDDTAQTLPTDIWWVKGTYSYTTVTGAKRTIWEIEAINEKELIAALERVRKKQ